MQFVVIAQDYTDDQALSRRLACRNEHFQNIRPLTDKGHFLLGGAMLNEAGQMIGSVLVCDFPSREALDELWLQNEPYMTQKVWEHVEIRPFNAALLGEKLFQQLLT